MEHGAAPQLLAGQIKDGERTNFGFGAAGLRLAPGNDHRGDKVLPGHGELKVAVTSIGQCGVKDGLTSAYAHVQRRNGLLHGLSGSGSANHKRHFSAIAIKTKVGKLRRGVGKDSSVEHQAALSA